MSVLDLEPLERRRLKCDLKVHFQISNGSTVLDIAHFFCFPTEPEQYQRAQPEKIEKQIVANKLLNNTFASRAIDCWNNLPENIVSASTLIQYKNMLNKIDLTNYLQGRTIVPMLNQLPSNMLHASIPLPLISLLLLKKHVYRIFEFNLYFALCI